MSSVCAIVLNYYGWQKTESCLKSLIGQPIDALYLVDNSVSISEVESLNTVISSLEERGIAFPIHLLANDQNLGFARGINTTLGVIRDKESIYQYYFLINNDGVVEPGTVEKLVTALRNEDEAVIASPRICTGESDGCFRWYNKLSGSQTEKPTPYSFPYITGCCILVRGDYIDNDILFDEEFFMYGEDALLSWQILRKNKKAICIDDATVVHEGTGSSTYGEIFYEYHMARAHVLLARKTANNSIEAILFLSGRALFLGIRGLVRAIRFRKIAPLIAVFLAWTHKEIAPPHKTG